MKRLYWQAHNVPKYLMIIMCIVALTGMFFVEYFKELKPQDDYQEKLAASQLATKAMKAVKDERLKRGYPIDKKLDPQNTGLIGTNESVVTTDKGALSSKRASINPNVAGLVVDWMKEAKVKKGDVVAVAMTGSFPALNICVLSAIRTLQLKPLIILSGGSSSYGANMPGFLFLNMLDYLDKEDILPYTPIAASIGGAYDYGKNLPKEGVSIIHNTIDALGIPFIDTERTSDSISQRLTLYSDSAKDKPIALYINVGGGTASIGLSKSKEQVIKSEDVVPHSMPSGYINTLPITLANTNSVAVRFLKSGIPVINLHEFSGIASKYHLPSSPLVEPIVGSGLIFYHKQYNKWLASGALIIVLLFLGIVTLVSRKFVIQYGAQ